MREEHTYFNVARSTRECFMQHSLGVPKALSATIKPRFGRPKTTRSRVVAAAAYSPRQQRRQDAISVGVSGIVLSSWTALFHHAVFDVSLAPSNLFEITDLISSFFLLEYAFTAMFITGHDSLHGVVCTTHHRINDVIGRICLALYAWFDFDYLYDKHHAHHAHVGQPVKDPDFHQGNLGFWSWYYSFMTTYFTRAQFLRCLIWTTLLCMLGAKYENVVLFVAVAPLLSSLRLFYYGTYIPHRPMNVDQSFPVQMTRSSDDSRALSMLKCFHFDYHLEHHLHPSLPWWKLPSVKDRT